MLGNNMKSYDKFVCLSGLPRSGSTLLSAILSQNPKIHAEGNSAVCQLMWDLKQSIVNNAKEQIAANNRYQTTYDLISQIPHIYYKNNNPSEKIVIDKCRSWTIPDNIDLLQKFIDANIKIIVLERPIIEIVKSFVKLYKNNGKETNLDFLLTENTEPIMRSLGGVMWAKQNNHKNTFLFISYKNLIENTEKTIKDIYDFCGFEYFTHDFSNIVLKYPENDDIYKLKGQHSIRPTIQKEENKTKLPDNIKLKCNMIDSMLGY